MQSPHPTNLSIQVASDLHLEHIWRALPGERLLKPAPGADILVLAGDIANGRSAVEAFADWPVDVLFVPGNHEHYDQPDLNANLVAMRAAAAGTKVHILEKDGITISGVRFLGCTLWTDYALYGHERQQASMEAAIGMVADHRAIRQNGSVFRPYHALGEHMEARAWLEAELGRSRAGEEWTKTVVVTHHAPHPRSVHPRFKGDALNPAFASDLHGLVGKADVWIHGHTHNSFDYQVEGCRVVANPRGYPLNLRTDPETVGEVVFENPEFKSDQVINMPLGMRQSQIT